jgi:diguanylate cyclase (GGDEF)-like protein
MGIPNPNKKWYLIIRSSIEDLREYLIKPGQTRIGRETDNDIVLMDPTASAHHAEVSYDQITNTISIQDLKSTNGTFVNGKKIHATQRMQEEDQIRIGHCYISIIDAEKRSSATTSVRPATTKVTGELIMESADQYGALLHEISLQLVNIRNLDSALVEISVLIKRMVGAEECQIVREVEFNKQNNLPISGAIVQQTIENRSAIIFADSPKGSSKTIEPITRPIQSMLLVPAVIDQQVVALIYARKPRLAPNPFNDGDLQLVLAVGNQVAMSIQRNQVENDLAHRSSHDELTDLPNRNLFLERLNKSISRTTQEKNFEFAVLFFDIDNFKDVNDSLGHATGDKLLVAVAERLKHNVRNIDFNNVISRFGGDEFAILLDNIKGNLFALSAANRLKDVLSNPFNINGKQIYATVSMGVAVSSLGYDNSDDILRDADMAMYQAKNLGKSRVEIYDKAMHERVSERLRMGTALRQGALQKEFLLHYQPIISLQNGQIVGHEALLRWHTPNRGILYPADFMHAIDTADLIYSTDYWVLQNACMQAAKWQKEFQNTPPLFMSVNLSAKNIKHPNLVKNITHLFQKTNLDPGSLHMEITEKVSTPDDEGAIEVIRELRSLGIRISLDDFGTGYSALNYLARLPIDALKIDRSFISMIGKNLDSHKIIEMIKSLADHLGLSLIAEGVETAEQAVFLQSIQCNYAQGFYYSKALDSQAATKLLKSDHNWE